MRLRVPREGLLVAAVVLAFVLAACGSDDSADQGDGNAQPAAGYEQTAAMKELAAAASREGELNLNWGMSQPNMGPFIEAFNAEYPGIEITVTPDQNQPANAAKLIQELKAGRPSSTDAFIGVPEFIWLLGPQRADALAAVDWASLAPWTEDLVGAEGTALTFFDQIPGFTYNTTMLDESELPTSAAEIPEIDQPIASTPYAAQFNVLATDVAMGREPLLEYLAGLDPDGMIGCGDLSRVASGEFAGLWIACGKNIGDIFAAQGAPLETHVVEDAAITYPWYMAVPKNAANPNAAKLWLIWMTTPTAQKILFEREFADNKRIEGSQTAEQIADYEAQGYEFIVADYQFVEANPDAFNPEFGDLTIEALTGR